MASVAALLLAAGESTRMGGLKALLPWQGKSLLEYQVATLTSAGVSLTVVVLGHQSERLQALLMHRKRVRWVHNPDYRQGKTTSLKTGLRALLQAQGSSLGLPEASAVLVLNVDQPRYPDTIRQIMERHRRGVVNASAGQTWLITVPTYKGKGGHPVILSTSLMAELMEISEEDMGLKAVVRRHEGETQRVEIDSPEILLDLNSPQDYDKAIAMAPRHKYP